MRRERNIYDCAVTMPEDLPYVELWIARLGWKGSVARRPRPRGWWRENERGGGGGGGRGGKKDLAHARRFGDSSRFNSGPHLPPDCATTRLILSKPTIVIHKYIFNPSFFRVAIKSQKRFRPQFRSSSAQEGATKGRKAKFKAKAIV